MIRALAAGLIAAALSMPPGNARADTTAMAIPEVAAPASLGGIAARLTQQIVATVATNPNIRVLGPQSVSYVLGPNLHKLHACGGAPACIAAHATDLKADRLIVGSLDRMDGSYIVRLWLVDLRSGVLVSKVDRTILIASRRLHDDVAAALPDLIEGRAEVLGKLSVLTTNTRKARVFVDGKEVGVTPVTVDAKPGKRTVRVVKAGYMEVERFVNVEPDGQATLETPLTALAGAMPDPDASVPAQAGGRGIPTGTWIAGGAAVAAAGAGAFFALRVDDLNKKAGAGPIYPVTRAEAQAGRRDAFIANGCFALAGAAAATAILIPLLSSGDAPPTTSAAVVPMQGGAALSLAGAF